MITNDDKALLVLNTLIRAGRDAEQGFLAAADRVPEPELVQLFADYAVQRARFVVELQERVRTMRGDPEQAGSIGGEVHRAWLGLKAALDSNEVHAILSECERGEDMAVRVIGMRSPSATSINRPATLSSASTSSYKPRTIACASSAIARRTRTAEEIVKGHASKLGARHQQVGCGLRSAQERNAESHSAGNGVPALPRRSV
jgi:uncharacterized protein (TIGR02284 family)